MSYNTTLNPVEVLRADSSNFEQFALYAFRLQYEYNTIYRQYCTALRIDPRSVTAVAQVPFMPISFFKTHKVVAGDPKDAEIIFESSGTTGEVPSRHYVRNRDIYEKSLLQGFHQFYGDPAGFAVLALLPSYLERGNASLVYMAKTLMANSNHPDNGYYINEWDKLQEVLLRLEQQQQKVLLLGVTFALLDFAEAHPMQLNNTIVMETGGMKGRREELTRAEVHSILKDRLGLHQVHSEYGMTELLSQAYALSDGLFQCPNTMQVFIRDINDPFAISVHGTGVLNVIDLANIYSCSFIATDDLARIHTDGSFEVLGRLDHTALRGCSLMAV